MDNGKKGREHGVKIETEENYKYYKVDGRRGKGRGGKN